jgi:hypothetical protein
LMSAGGKTVSAAGWCCFVAGGLVRHGVAFLSRVNCWLSFACWDTHPPVF